jgi:carboxylate-amine ligase
VSQPGCSNRFKYDSRVGDAQKLAPDEQIAFARDAFENAADLTVAVEEEFQLLDPDTLELTGRFTELKEAAAGTELDEHLVGELISSEIEVKTGRCGSFAEAAERMAERRRQLGALVDAHGVALASTGTHPWSRWQDQHIIDTPHYRRNDEILRYVVWRNNSFGIHVHVAVRGPDRAVAVCNAFRNVLPELLAFSASSPFLEDVVTGLHSVRTEIFTRMFPRCGVPDPYEGWAGFEEYVRFLYDTGSIDEHTQMWWSVRPHLAFPTIEVRICDAQPELRDAQALAALIHALGARFARAIDEGEPLPSLPHRLIEENMWRAIRHGLSGELIDFERNEVVPARERIEALLEWVAPVAAEIDAAAFLDVPAANSAERQYARLEAVGSHRAVFAELVRVPERVA